MSPKPKLSFGTTQKLTIFLELNAYNPARPQGEVLGSEGCHLPQQQVPHLDIQLYKDAEGYEESNLTISDIKFIFGQGGNSTYFLVAFLIVLTEMPPNRVHSSALTGQSRKVEGIVG